jgi:hypothetical protein
MCLAASKVGLAPALSAGVSNVGTGLLMRPATAAPAEAIAVLLLPSFLLLLVPLLLWLRVALMCLLPFTRNPGLMRNGRPPVLGVLVPASSGAKMLESIALLLVPLLATALLLVLAAGFGLALLHCLALLVLVLVGVLSVGRTTSLLPRLVSDGALPGRDTMLNSMSLDGRCRALLAAAGTQYVL